MSGIRKKKREKTNAKGNAPRARRRGRGAAVGVEGRRLNVKEKGFEKHVRIMERDRKLAGGVLGELGAATIIAAKSYFKALAGYPSLCQNIGRPGFRGMMPCIPINLRPRLTEELGAGADNAIYHEGDRYLDDLHAKEAVDFKRGSVVDFHRARIIAWRARENRLEVECDEFFLGACHGRILLVFENPSIRFMHGSMIVDGPGRGNWELGDGKPFLIGRGKQFRRNAELLGRRINISELSAASERWPEFRLVYGHGGGKRSHGLSIGSFECAIAFSGFKMACGEDEISEVFESRKREEKELEALWEASPEMRTVESRCKRRSI